jgi:putative salt-induced outer membrane protein
MKLLILSTLLALSAAAQAQDSAAKWTNETGLTIVNVDGNTKSESYSANTKLARVFDSNTLSLSGKYLVTKAGSLETARAWEAGARYERALSDSWSAFVAHGAESNSFAGFTQRDNTDLGGKYFFFKSDEGNWFAEAGVRLTKTLPVLGDVKNQTFGRLYTEYNGSFSKTATYKFWVEYLPNFTDSKAYLANLEPSVSVVLSEVFSLKTAYLVKYQEVVAATAKQTDTQFTTSLVAKF